MMNNTILKCLDCGAILVVNNSDLWKIRKCTSCESTNLENVDDNFDLSEVGDNDGKYSEEI